MQVADTGYQIVFDDQLNGKGVVGIDPLSHLLISRPAVLNGVVCKLLQIPVQPGFVFFEAGVVYFTAGADMSLQQLIPKLMGDAAAGFRHIYFPGAGDGGWCGCGGLSRIGFDGRRWFTGRLFPAAGEK